MREEIERELVRDEVVLWTGAPAKGLRLRGSDVVLIPFSMMWCGFALFWEGTVLRANAPFFFKLWGIPFVVIGLYLVVGRFFVDARRRATTVYAVTDQRVLIVSRLFGRKVMSLVRSQLPAINVTTHASGRGTITFGTAVRGQPAAPAFEMITEPKTVMELLLPSSATGLRVAPTQVSPPLQETNNQRAASAGRARAVAIAVQLVAFVAVVGFFVGKLFWHSETVGQVTLRMYFESPQKVRLQLPTGWRAQYGHERHDKCALLLDAARAPRFFACAYGYLPDDPHYSGEGRQAALTATVTRAIDGGAPVQTETRQTSRGARVDVVTTTRSGAPGYFGVVKSGIVTRAEYVTVVDDDLIVLKFEEDAAQRATLDPIAWQMVQTARIVH